MHGINPIIRLSVPNSPAAPDPILQSNPPLSPSQIDRVILDQPISHNIIHKRKSKTKEKSR